MDDKRSVPDEGELDRDDRIEDDVGEEYMRVDEGWLLNKRLRFHQADVIRMTRWRE